MEKRKHYVYAVNATRLVCGNLQSAIEIAMDDMYRAEKAYMNNAKVIARMNNARINNAKVIARMNNARINNAKLSAPIITKTLGGYQVVTVGYDGIIRKRHIDVFEPYKQPQGRKQYKVDRAYAMHYKR